MQILKTLSIAIGLASSTSAAAQEAPISIECTGENRSSVGNCSMGQIGQAGTCWTTPTRSNVVVFVQIDQGSGRVRIPSNLFELRSDGWVEIDELEVGGQYITGRLPFSSFTKPRMRIDRYAGTIDIHSSSTLGSSFRFSGICQRSELNVQRF